MKCIDCKVGYCVYKSTNPQQECALQNTAGTIISKPSEGKKDFIVPEGTAMTVDWSAFRREAAKLMLPVTSNWKLTKATASMAITKNAAVKLAIEYADELIKQLKDEPKKGL